MVGTVTEVVAESCIEFLMVVFRVGFDLFGCLFEGFEMGSGIVIAEGMIGDDGEALFQEGLEFGVHGLSIFFTAETQRSQRVAEENLNFRG